eukprot:6172651-Pleurochrysis_carterae.AAC.4
MFSREAKCSKYLLLAGLQKTLTFLCYEPFKVLRKIKQYCYLQVSCTIWRAVLASISFEDVAAILAKLLDRRVPYMFT